MNFFGVGPAEAGVIFAIALIVIGPQRFPEIMRQAGRWYRVARAYSNEVMKDVRAAVDEIEQEVRADTEDLRSVRELTDLKADLIEARESVKSIQQDTTAAAQTGDSAAARSSTTKPAATKPAAATPATTKSSTTPSTTRATDTEATPAATDAQTTSTRPSVIKAAKEKAAEPPASYYEGRDPSTFDPFKAKEARDAARKSEDATSGTDHTTPDGNGPNGNGAQ